AVGQQFLVGEGGDRLHAVAQFPPEPRGRLRPRSPQGHPDHRDGVVARVTHPYPRFRTAPAGAPPARPNPPCVPRPAGGPPSRPPECARRRRPAAGPATARSGSGAGPAPRPGGPAPRPTGPVPATA